MTKTMNIPETGGRQATEITHPGWQNPFGKHHRVESMPRLISPQGERVVFNRPVGHGKIYLVACLTS